MLLTLQKLFQQLENDLIASNTMLHVQPNSVK